MMATANNTQTYLTPEGVQITGAFDESYAAILTPEALAFIASLQR